MISIRQAVRSTLRAAAGLARVQQSHVRLTASAGVLVAAVSMSWAPGALAQEAGAGQSDALEEVTVTATRQASNVNRVALAVTAVTQKSLEVQGLKDVNDLSRTVPDVTFRKTGTDGNPVITIRGVGGNGATVGAQTTGIYLDDSALQQRMVNALQTGNGAPVPELFDLDRVEVLRGPQGTLYGGSSEGGTIRFITPTPSLTQYSGQLRAEVSSTEGGSPSYSGAAAIGGPIVEDVLGFRASFIHRYEGGWVDAKSMYDGHTFAKDTNYGVNDGFRGTLLWKVNSSFTVTPALYIGRQYSNAPDTVWGNSPEMHYAGGTIYNGTGGCQKAGDPTGVPGSAGVCSVSIGTYNPATGVASVQPYYFSFPNTVVKPFTVNAMPWYNFNSTGNGYYGDPANPVFMASPRVTNLMLPSLTLDEDFGPVQMKSITSYVANKTDGLSVSGTTGGARNQSRFMFGATDCIPGMTTPRNAPGGGTACYVAPAYIPAAAVGTYTDGTSTGYGSLPAYMDYYHYSTHRNAITEELRFNGMAFHDRLSYVAGAFFSNSNIYERSLEQNNENAYSEVIRGLPEYWGAFTGLMPLDGALSTSFSLDGPFLGVSDRLVSLHEKEWAAFTELNFNITDKLKLTAGVRYDQYSQTFDQVYGSAPAGNPPLGSNPLNVSPTNPLGGFTTTAALVQAASRDTSLPNSPTNPIVNPANLVLWADNLAGCPTAVDCPLQYTNMSEHEVTTSPKAGLSYQISPTDLVYFTYSRGYRPGGVNQPISQVPCATDFTRLGITTTPLTYKQDSVDNYEIGNKIRLLDGRMQINTSAFHISWNGMQYNYSMTCGFFFVTNAGKVSSNGAEIEAASRFGNWTLGTNISYDHAAFAQNLVIGNSAPLVAKGDGVGTPDWTVSMNAQYDFLIRNLPGFIRADYNYTSSYQRGPGPGSGNYNPYTYLGPAFFTVNARLGLTWKKIDWSLFVQNIGNVQPMIGWAGGTTGSNSVPGTDSLRDTGLSIRPRQIGIQANYHF